MPRNRSSLLAAPLLGLALLAGPQVPARAQGQDIECMTTHVRYDVPGECTGGPCNTVRRIEPLHCALSPRCAALQNDVPLRQYYNAALFGVGLSLRPRESLVARIINLRYRPANAPLFAISVSGSISGFAEVGNRKNVDGKHALAVHPDLFLLSPAMIGSAVGHEMVHYFQFQRRSTVNLTGIDAADSVFREIEASSWESGVAGYTWPHGPNPFFACLVTKAGQSERQGVLDLLACRNWQARKVIESIRTSPRSNLARLEAYLKDNPFTKAVWLPQNPSWKTYTAGPKPSTCP